MVSVDPATTAASLPPCDLVSLCLHRIAAHIDQPALFRAMGDEPSPDPQELHLLASKLASQVPLSTHEIVKLLVLWLGARRELLLPVSVQLSLLEQLPWQVLWSTAPVEELIVAVRRCLAQMGPAAAATVQPLVLFLHQYLLCQREVEAELAHVARVFAPLLFNACSREAPEFCERTRHLTALMVSHAIEIFCPDYAPARVDPTPNNVGAPAEGLAPMAPTAAAAAAAAAASSGGDGGGSCSSSRRRWPPQPDPSHELPRRREGAGWGSEGGAPPGLEAPLPQAWLATQEPCEGWAHMPDHDWECSSESAAAEGDVAALQSLVDTTVSSALFSDSEYGDENEAAWRDEPVSPPCNHVGGSGADQDQAVPAALSSLPAAQAARAVGEEGVVCIVALDLTPRSKEGEHLAQTLGSRLSVSSAAS